MLQCDTMLLASLLVCACLVRPIHKQTDPAVLLVLRSHDIWVLLPGERSVFTRARCLYRGRSRILAFVLPILRRQWG